MSKKEKYLELFKNNELSLALAIYLYEKYGEDVLMVKGDLFIENLIEELNKELH